MSTVNSKRKRVEEENDVNGTDNEVVPDPIESINGAGGAANSTAGDLGFVLPENGFPTTDQLAQILSYLDGPESYQTSLPTSEFLLVLESLEKRLRPLPDHFEDDEDEGEEEEADREDEKFVSMMTSFHELGGALRMIMLIKTHMDKPKVVAAAASACASSLRSQYYHVTDELVNVKAVACKSLERYHALNVLVLASEERIPSDQRGDWATIANIWLCIRNFCACYKWENLPQNQYMVLVDERGQFLTGKGVPRTIKYRLQTLEHICLVLYMILKNHTHTMKLIFEEKCVLDPIYTFCNKNKSQWLLDYDSVAKVVDLCSLCASHGILSKNDLLKWLPLVTSALTKWYTKCDIESPAYDFIEFISTTVNHRELDNTPLVTALMSIVQSSDASRITKDTYRTFISNLMF
jgi:hypothetical protein